MTTTTTDIIEETAVEEVPDWKVKYLVPKVVFHASTVSGTYRGGKDRTLAGKARRLARKAARR